MDGVNRFSLDVRINEWITLGVEMEGDTYLPL